jgi:hypothetical protein
MMRQLLAQKAGFGGRGENIIVDENMSPNLASVLRDQGFGARSVRELGLRSVDDANIKLLAEQVNARVLTYDRGRQLDGGLGSAR